MGRPKKTMEQSTGHLTVEDQESKLATEEAMEKLESLTGDPPEWLDKDAQEEWNRILPLYADFPIKKLDLALVAAYCQSFSDYINATKRMNSGDPIIETDRGTKLNQNHAIKRDALSQMNSIAPKIGLSIDSRMKIFTPKPKKNNDDPFEVMFNAKKK